MKGRIEKQQGKREERKRRKETQKGRHEGQDRKTARKRGRKETQKGQYKNGRKTRKKAGGW